MPNIIFNIPLYFIRITTLIEIQGRGFDSQPEALELQFSQLVPVGS